MSKPNRPSPLRQTTTYPVDPVYPTPRPPPHRHQIRHFLPLPIPAHLAPSITPKPPHNLIVTDPTGRNTRTWNSIPAPRPSNSPTPPMLKSEPITSVGQISRPKKKEKKSHATGGGVWARRLRHGAFESLD